MADEPPQKAESPSEDFSDAMQMLASQAQRFAQSQGAGDEAQMSPSERKMRSAIVIAMGQFIRPLTLGIESLQRTTAEQSLLLQKLTNHFLISKKPNGGGPESVEKRGGESDSSATAALTSESAQMIEKIAADVHRIGHVESANQKLFDALHTELRGYKDNFLFDALQKPFVNDLTRLFDDLCAVREQTRKGVSQPSNKNTGSSASEGKKKSSAAKEVTSDMNALIETVDANLENLSHHFLEIFQRLDVELVETAAGLPVDKKIHRVISIEEALSPEEDSQVARSLKKGFIWKGRTIRPEEIVAKRWKKAEAARGSEETKESEVVTNSTAEKGKEEKKEEQNH